MRWDDDIFVGREGDYDWIVTSRPVRESIDLALKAHVGLRLWVATLHCGPVEATFGLLLRGWLPAGEGLVHPNPHLLDDVPRAHNDEYYFLPGNRLPGEAPPYRFVNYGQFNLESSTRLEESFDPSWERGVLSWMDPMQSAFWEHLATVGAVTYIGDGDRMVIATQRRDFFEAMVQSARDAYTLG